MIPRLTSTPVTQQMTKKRMKVPIMRANSIPINYNHYTFETIDGEALVKLLNEITESRVLFVSESSSHICAFEKIYQKLRKFTHGKELTIAIDIYLADQSRELFNTFKSEMEVAPSYSLLKKLIQINTKTTLFYSYVFASWRNGPMSAQKKVISELHSSFIYDEKFTLLIINETLKFIDMIRLTGENDKQLQWVIDFFVKIGIVKEFLKEFEKNAQMYLSQNLISEFNSATIIKDVEAIIKKNDEIFRLTPIFNEVNAIFSNIAYNKFVISQLNYIFDAAFDSRDYKSISDISSLLSELPGMEERYSTLWANKVSKTVNSLFQSPDLQTIPQLISINNFIESLKRIIPENIYKKLQLVLVRALNDAESFGIYLIARHIHNSTIADPDFQNKINDVITILNRFEDKSSFTGFFMHFYCNRLIRYFSEPPPIEKIIQQNLENFIAPKEFRKIAEMEEQISVAPFEYNETFPIKFKAIAPQTWIPPPAIKLTVPPEIEAARAAFLKELKSKRNNIALKFTPMIDEVTFTYKGVSFVGFYPYLYVLKKVTNNEDLSECEIPSPYVHEILVGLSKMGLIQKMAGKYIAVAKYRPQKKINKFPQFSAYIPKVPKRLASEELFIKRKPNVEIFVCKYVKQNTAITTEELDAIIIDKAPYSLTKREIEASIASLIATGIIVMGCDRKLVYVG